MTARPGIYRYVVHELVEDYMRLGWLWVAYAGHWSSIMFWPCQCPAPELRR